MSEQTTASLRCDDGTEVTFEWVYPGAEEFEWIRDRAHWPQPMTPIEAWARNNAWPGADRAWQEVGMEATALFYRFQLAGPFQYVRMTPYAQERMAEVIPGYRAAVRRHGNAAAFWRQHSQPRIQRVCRDFAGADDAAPLRSTAGEWAYGFHQTFTAMALLGEANLRLVALLTEAVGDDATLLAFEVTQGGENASQMIDTEISELAARARQVPGVAQIFSTAESGELLATLRRERAAGEFVLAFDALVERHGSRSQGWDVSLPTWRERPETPLALVQAQLESSGTSTEELTGRSTAIRKEATARALSFLSPDKHAEFAQIVAELDGYVGVREGRAYWQMVLTGELRGLLLRRGAALVSAGRVDRADDILFLVPADFEDDGLSDLRGLVAERRREWEHWRKVVTPPVIGTAMTAPTAAAEPARNELRGAPASRGEVTGRARILTDSEQGSRLKSGDILVCVMTTPAWTPLFSIAAGIITETGGALSHPAITAREYGIPAVVAVQGATTIIRDGQTVTIDGGSGRILLHT